MNCGIVPDCRGRNRVRADLERQQMKNTITGTARRVAMLAVISFVLGLGFAPAADTLIPTAAAQQSGEVPGQSLGTTSDSDFWRQVRGGEQGAVTIPDKQAGVMIQSGGENWRNIRNGPVSTIGLWSVLGVIIVLAVFFALRGRIRIDSGVSGKQIQRFKKIEVIAHWLVAGSFIILAITGLNILYGRYLFGGVSEGPGNFGALHQVFAALAYYGKFAHNFVAFAFMAGIVMIFVLWVRDNIPNRTDLKWLAVAGGLFRKGVHPPAKKFNAGQKFIFWAVVLGGISLSLSGLSLMFPFTMPIFAKTFAALSIFGLPTDLTMIEEMQLSQLWHAIVALVMIAIIIAHIYIGSLGMEGAFDAMGTGMVDENWAREHHGLWVAEIKGEAPPADHGGSGGASPSGEKGTEAPQTA